MPNSSKVFGTKETKGLNKYSHNWLRSSMAMGDLPIQFLINYIIQELHMSNINISNRPCQCPRIYYWQEEVVCNVVITCAQSHELTTGLLIFQQQRYRHSNIQENVIRDSKSPSSLKSYYKSKCIKKPIYYYSGTRIGQILHMRLRTIIYS